MGTATPAGLTPCHRAHTGTKLTPSPHHNTKSLESQNSALYKHGSSTAGLHYDTSGTVATTSATPVTPPLKLVMSSSCRDPRGRQHHQRQESCCWLLASLVLLLESWSLAIEAVAQLLASARPAPCVRGKGDTETRR